MNIVYFRSKASELIKDKNPDLKLPSNSSLVN